MKGEKDEYLPESVRIAIKKDVLELKEILKEDPVFARELINGLHDITIKKAYPDTFYFRVKAKYDHNEEFPHTWKLICLVDDLACLVGGEHKSLVELQGENFDNALSRAIEEEITNIFFHDVTEEANNTTLLGEMHL